MSQTKIVTGIFIFDDVEVLDFAGPFEVFSRARTEPGPQSRRSDATAPFDVFTVARTVEPVQAIGGLTVQPAFGFDDVPDLDLLIIPGGFGTRGLLEDDEVLAWIAKTAAKTAQTASVCTGALLLARLGLLRQKRATTHWAALDLLAEIDPTIRVQRGARFVDDGLVTSAGVAAGIDMSFALVERYCGKEVADETAQYIEYPRTDS